MSLVVEYKGYYAPLSDVPSDIKSKWLNTLLSRRQLIYERIMTKIPDDSAFIKYLADPSAEVWKDFVSPYWINAEMIKLKQNVKIHIAGPRYRSAVIKAFQSGGIFETNVQEKADRFSQAKYTLGGVGVRFLMGWGPEYKAVGAITGDKRIKRYIGAGETFSGTPVCVFPEGIVKFLRPTLIAKLTQGIILAQYAHEAGMSDLRDSVINTVNSDIAQIISANKKPEYDVTLEIGFDSAEGKLFVYAKVTKVA